MGLARQGIDPQRGDLIGRVEASIVEELLVLPELRLDAVAKRPRTGNTISATVVEQK
jgi:hypothetical protein